MRYFLIALLIFSGSAHALQSLRVGNHVLAVGDSATRVRQLLGEPAVQKDAARGKGKPRKAAPPSGKDKQAKSKDKSKNKAKDKGERWQYQREGHLTTFTIVAGKIARIDDVAR
jgi:hypothetical protein